MLSRRKAMKGRLYFATKAQKDGKILIKTHPCAQIFCCDVCGFEKVSYLRCSFYAFSVTGMQRLCPTTGWHSDLKVAATTVFHSGCRGNMCWDASLQVDAEQYYSELEEKWTDEFNAEKNRVSMKRLGVAFVTFRDERMTAV